VPQLGAPDLSGVLMRKRTCPHMHPPFQGSFQSLIIIAFASRRS
jgi:hypothetical protein